MFLPRALSAAADATNALHRLEELLEADLRSDDSRVDRSQDVAVRASNATFQWMTAASEETEKQTNRKKEKSQKSETQTGASGDSTPKQQEPFSIPNLTMEIPRGKLVAIVGSVGSGKSSILSGLIGEMKQISGTVKFGGKIAYCAQHAFIQNATLRDNVLFGQPWDEDRYWQVIEDACLIPDCLQLPDGDLTGKISKSESVGSGLNVHPAQKSASVVSTYLEDRSSVSMSREPYTTTPRLSY